MAIEDSRNRTVAHTPLLMDDATLLLNLLVGKRQRVSPIVEDKQTRVDNLLLLNRHVHYVVHRLISAGVCVQVHAKLNALRLQPRQNQLVREVFRAIETHVLKEVSQTILVLVFLHRTHLLGDMEVSLSFWIFIMAYIVRQSIRQFSDSNRRVRQLLRHLRSDIGSKQQHRQHHEHLNK